MLDADRFDALVRTLDRALPRRTTRRWFPGAVLFAITALAAVEGAEARRKVRRRRKRCRGTRKKCGGQCVNVASSAANCGACGVACPSGQCIHGACVCESSTECPGSCQCSPRRQGLSACRSAIADQPCDDDGDCPLRSFCLANFDQCSAPCFSVE